MEQGSELQRLEKFVEKILTRFSALKADKEQLEQELFDRDLLIEELRENLSSKATERNEISQRVNKIVDQIEEWELSLGDTGEAEMSNLSDSPDFDKKETASETQEHEIGSHDEDKRVQHGLFSMTGSK